MAKYGTAANAVTSGVATVSSTFHDNRPFVSYGTGRISSLRLIKPDMDIAQHVLIATNWEEKVFSNAADQVGDNLNLPIHESCQMAYMYLSGFLRQLV